MAPTGSLGQLASVPILTLKMMDCHEPAPGGQKICCRAAFGVAKMSARTFSNGRNIFGLNENRGKLYAEWRCWSRRLVVMPGS